MLYAISKRLPQIFFFLLSFGIAASAQPDWSLLSCLGASSIGYALFWKSMLYTENKKGRFVLAFLWFALVELCHLNWFLADRYVGFYIYPVLLFILGWLGLQFGILSFFIRDPKEMRMIKMLGISGGWTLFEWSRLFLLSGFSWDPVGLELTATIFGLQMSSIFGLYSLSFWVIFTNLLALHFFFQTSRKGIILWGCALAAPYLFGMAHLAFHTQKMQKNGEPPLKALLVQTALIPEARVSVNGSDPLTPLRQWDRILHLLFPALHEHTARLIPASLETDQDNTFSLGREESYVLQDNLLQTVDLIVLPEGVVPFGTNFPIYSKEAVFQIFRNYFEKSDFLPIAEKLKVGNAFWAQALANAAQVDVIIGLDDVEFNPAEKSFNAYNAAFVFHPFSLQADRYEKRVLVPMGEYIPFNWCKKILSKYGIADSFTPGVGAKVFQAGPVNAGLSICYEETYGHLMRESRKLGADILINLTNDVWYPRSRLPVVHLLHGRIRAVESGVPMLRACNTGVTCGIDSLGRIVSQLPYESSRQESAAATLVLELPRYHYKTLYAYWGDSVVICISLLFFGMILVVQIIKSLNSYRLRKTTP